MKVKILISIIIVMLNMQLSVQSAPSLKSVIQTIKSNAVYKARMLYAYYVPNIFFDNLEICNNLGIYRTNGDSTEYEKEQALLDEDSKTINDNKVNLNFVKLFPNPTNGQITIEYAMPKSSSGQLKIMDILGNTIQIIELKSNVKRVTTNLDNLSKGVYIFQYSVDNIIQKNGKLIIK